MDMFPLQFQAINLNIDGWMRVFCECFQHGAMENWGLVTYRASALFIDPEGASDYHMQRVHEIVSHELAHQWFGNLVTMQWWTDLWLNEGNLSSIK